MALYLRRIVCQSCVKLLAVLFFVFNLVSCHVFTNPIESLPYFNSQDLTPTWDSKNIHHIAPFNLIDQTGKEFGSDSLMGKIYIANFFFTTCPSICPKMTKSMGDIQKEFMNDDEVMLLSHSVNPEKDSVSILKKYAKEKNVNFNRWKLLTGNKEEIYDLGRNYYFVEEDEGIKKGNDIFLHTENFILIDKQRHIRGIYNGLDPNSIENLIKDIRILKEK